MTVAENVAFGLQQRKVPTEQIGGRVGEALEMVRLGHLERRRPTELSGGQQQRVALARALVNRPTVLLLDEPLGALDLKLRKEMQVELKELQQQVGITFVYVTHDQEEALTMSDRIAVMHDGHVLQEGAPREIYERPATRFVADFIGLTNFLDGEVVDLMDNRVLVKTPEGLTIWCESQSPPAQGSAVTVAVRPEKIEMSEQASNVALNSWRGQVLTGTFLGEQTEYLVRLDQGPQVAVRRQNLLVNGSGPAASPGSFVYLAWAPEVSLVLPRSKAT
jgi:spermidine/putrescine transport system ATP-binding protein